MDQTDVKKRDVVSFEEFVKAYDKVKKIIPLKAGEKVHYGMHDIKGEPLYVRNDANPYKAFGIPHDEKQADANQKGMSANQVDVFDGVEAKSDKGKDKATDPKHDKDTKKAAKDAAAIVGNMSTAIILDEAVSYKKDDLEKTMKKEEVDENQEGKGPTDAELTAQYFGMIDSENTSSKEFEDCEKEMVKRGLSTEHPKK